MTTHDSADHDEDLILLNFGSVLFAEGATARPVSHGQIFAEAGSLLLRAGDNVSLDSNSAIVAAHSIAIYGDINAVNNTIDTVDADPKWGSTIVLCGQIVAGAVVTAGNPIGTYAPSYTAPAYLTRIWGNAEADVFQFGDTSGAVGGTNWGSAGYVFLGSKTRVYGGQDEDSAVTDGEDQFIVFYLQDTSTTTCLGTVSAAEHTLTLDGQAGTDSYEIYTTGSQGAPRNYLINVLDTGAKADGADTLAVYGFDRASPSGFVDDIFLLRRVTSIANEVAESPAFVALLHGTIDKARLAGDAGDEESERPQKVQRVNYDANINGRLTVYGLAGDDWFAIDDNSAVTTLDGGAGNDMFQTGQIYGSQRKPANVSADDEFETIATTRGYLSCGVSMPLVAQGGDGNDSFGVYSNTAELRLEGDAGNDMFIVRAFALAETDSNGDIVMMADPLDPGRQIAKPKLDQISLLSRTDIRPGDGDDTIQYNINAPVSIDGGSGFDKVLVIGTEFPDNFIITEEGVFGAGLAVCFTNVEAVEVDSLEGDDDFFVISTPFGVAMGLVGGLGSDTFNVGGDVSETIVSGETEGVSGVINHELTSGDGAYNGLPAPGVDYNVAQAEAGVVIIEESGGSTSVREGTDGTVDSYTVLLAVAPAAGTKVYVTVSAARSEEEEEDGGGDSILVRRAGDATVDPTTFTRGVGKNGSVQPTPNRATVLVFDSANWNMAQRVEVKAAADTLAEGARVVSIGHSVLARITDTSLDSQPGADGLTDQQRTIAAFDQAVVRSVEAAVIDDDAAGLVITESNGQTRVLEGSLSIQGGYTKGLADSYTLQLAKAPTAKVVVKFAFDSTQVQLASGVVGRFSGSNGVATLSFDGTNWNLPVAITVTALDDSQREDPAISMIAHSFDSTLVNRDTSFDEVTESLDVEVLDDDTAGVVVEETDGSTLVSKDGTTLTDQYTVRLTSAPNANVSVTIITEGPATTVPQTLTFSAGNWWILQTVTVKGHPGATATERTFTNDVHLLNNLHGPLLVVGGSMGPRALLASVLLPAENNEALIGIGAQPPEVDQIDTLNIYDDSSQEDKDGTLSSNHLSGLGMAPDLVFADTASGQSITVPGGIKLRPSHLR